MRKLIAGLGQSKVPVLVSDVRGIDSTMATLNTELERRTANPNESFPTILVAIANISRFRELRRSEEFSFGDDSGGAIKPDAVLANILRDGPSLGIHVWIWADSAGTLSRWVSRQSLRDIELRILMQMSANDSNQLIDSNAANRLDRYVALIHDDIEGKSVKFRPFELESAMRKLA
jgi:DNA segregation ATPase FtsK/SpoIIIE, S-DNA-T family